MHYMLSAWWIHLMAVLGNYIICPGVIEQVVVMNINLTTLGHTYSIFRINKIPDIVFTLTHLGQLIA